MEKEVQGKVLAKVEQDQEDTGEEQQIVVQRNVRAPVNVRKGKRSEKERKSGKRQ